MESSWDSGFIFGALTGSFAMMYANRDKKHQIPQHTGDDCIYCKEYGNVAKK